eukprot:sb/3470269/
MFISLILKYVLSVWRRRPDLSALRIKWGTAPPYRILFITPIAMFHLLFLLLPRDTTTSCTITTCVNSTSVIQCLNTTCDTHTLTCHDNATMEPRKRPSNLVARPATGGNMTIRCESECREVRSGRVECRNVTHGQMMGIVLAISIIGMTVVICVTHHYTKRNKVQFLSDQLDGVIGDQLLSGQGDEESDPSVVVRNLGVDTETEVILPT